MVKRFPKTGLLMLVILGVVIPAGITAASAVDYDARRGDATDRFGDGTPDFLRLDSPEDRDAFRRWFAVIAEYQALRPDKELPPEISDCSALIRYAYRNALHGHDEAWFQETQLRPPEALPSVEKYGYPHTLLGAALFRVKPGAYAPGDARSASLR